MRDIPASGYTVLVTDLKHLLTDEEQKELDSLLEDCAAGEQICELLNSCIPGIPPINEVYYYCDEDSSEDFERGNFYAIFDEDDLFEKIPKPALTFLNSKKVEPKFSRWSVWA